MTVVFEEEQPVPTSPGSGKWIVKVNEVEETPRGSRRVLRSVSYRFKAAAAAFATFTVFSSVMLICPKNSLRYLGGPLSKNDLGGHRISNRLSNAMARERMT